VYIHRVCTLGCCTDFSEFVNLGTHRVQRRHASNDATTVRHEYVFSFFIFFKRRHALNDESVRHKCVFPLFFSFCKRCHASNDAATVRYECYFLCFHFRQALPRVMMQQCVFLCMCVCVCTCVCVCVCVRVCNQWAYRCRPWLSTSPKAKSYRHKQSLKSFSYIAYMMNQQNILGH
jgi:hypothetical protein